MKQENKALLIKYIVCFGVALILAFFVCWIQGFFTDSIAVNLQILSDSFMVSGFLMTMIAAMMFIGGEGGFIGIGFVLRNAFLAFIPMGRKRHEKYADYRERKLKEAKRSSDHCILVAGLTFLAIGIVFVAIWYFNFYNVPV